MRILIAPLNWGLGHATRCIPLIRQYLQEGADVVLGGTGESLQLLHKHFPTLTTVELAPLHLHYNQGKSQVSAMLRALPQFVRFIRKNRKCINAVVCTMEIETIISDNCFGVYSLQCENIYITHQLHICLPKGWKWLEPIADKVHARLYANYQQIWVPDNENGETLSGILGHPKNIDKRVRYIGPLSRFTQNEEIKVSRKDKYDVVAVLSGLEPQRTIFEKEIIDRYANSEKRVFIARGKVNEPDCIDDDKLKKVLYGAEHIIARSGYSTIMDLWALGLLKKAELHPTPGQPEQEYLAQLHQHS